MKISYKWLQNYFEKRLPAPEEVARLLTMHAFEIEGVEKVGEDTVLDVKVLPNMAHSCLSHRGIAEEVSAITGLARKEVSVSLPGCLATATTKKLSITIADPKKCRRYVGRVVEGVKIGPSPQWLRDALTSIGQKSINNVVDATNFVMFEIGQPLHAFDADKLSQNGIAISVEDAVESVMTTLDNKEVKLDPSTLVIASAGQPLAIAGVKGGKYAEIDANTKHIVIEAANFDSVLVRKTSRRLNIITDSSKRFENEISPELAGEGMDMVTRLIVAIAGNAETKVSAPVDVYPRKAGVYKVGMSQAEVSAILGVSITEEEIEDILKRLAFPFEKVMPRDTVIALAPKYLNAPYVYGASVLYDAPQAFDCSSFTAYLFVQAGLAIPRMAFEQFRFGRSVEEKDLLPGDLVFSKTLDTKITEGNTEEVTHVGVYLGDGKIIHAAGKPVSRVVMENLVESDKFKDRKGYRRMIQSDESRFVISVPAQRLDIRAKEDLIEEIGRIYGYEKITSLSLPPLEQEIAVHKLFYYATKVRALLNQVLFTEISTYAMVGRGVLELQNPMASDKAFMRANLADAMNAALTLNARNADLIGTSRVRLFEIGKVFDDKGEYTRLALGVRGAGALAYNKKDGETLKLAIASLEKELGASLPVVSDKDGVVEIDFDSLVSNLAEPQAYDAFMRNTDAHFRSLSAFPFISRDMAVFLPEGSDGTLLEKVFIENATDLCVHYRLFDVFTKTFPDGTKKISYAHRLVFQSHEKTLTEGDVAPIMESITTKVKAIPGAEVR